MDTLRNSISQERSRWKRLCVLILSVLQSYFFLPSSQALSSKAEAAEAPAPVVRPKRTQAKRSSRPPRKTGRSIVRKVLRGRASWYGFGFNGKKTASGVIFDQHKLTAAHKTLPLGSKAIVTNLNNGNSVEVEINDRGPYVPERVIDVSYAAAKELGFVKSGTAPVRIELVQDGHSPGTDEGRG